MDNSEECKKIIYEVALVKQQDGVTTGELEALLPNEESFTIVGYINQLLSQTKLEIVTQEGSDTIRYRGISQAELQRMGSLDTDGRLIYKHIENSGNEGIWVRVLKQKTNLLQNVITRSLKTLEQQGLVKSVKSVKHPTRKLYMLKEITPSAEITGGPWYTDQEMDLDFINQIAGYCEKFIYAQSRPRNRPETIYSANHSGYPTASVIRRNIMRSSISTVELGLDNVEEILSMLVYDGKVERLRPAVNEMGGEWVYRALPKRKRESPLTEVPCGRCPVEERCHEGGEIEPASCEYFQRWLAF